MWYNMSVCLLLSDQYVKIMKICLQMIIHICVIKGGKPYLEFAIHYSNSSIINT